MENSLCFFPFKESIVKKLQEWDLQGDSAWLGQGGRVKKGAFKIREQIFIISFLYDSPSPLFAVPAALGKANLPSFLSWRQCHSCRASG